MNRPLKVFITYARTDKAAKDKLIKSLAVMTRSGLIEIWHDTEMLGGDRWQHEIFSTHLPTSDLLLYLVSIDSLASENCYEEFEVALEKKIRVISVIFSDCDWKGDQQLSNFQVFPDDGTPINEWFPETKGWQNAVKGIRKTVEKMLLQSEPASGVSEKDIEAEVVFQHGNFLLKLGQLDMAIVAYSEAIKCKPDYAEAYNNRGVAYNEKGEYDLAIKDCSKAIALRPKLAEAYNNRGHAYREKGAYDLAIGDFNEAIELKTDFAEAYNNRGHAYKEKRTYDLAIGDFNKAIELKTDFATAYHNRAIAYYFIDKFDQAIGDFNKVIQLCPDDAIAYYMRAMVRLPLREWEKVKTDLIMASGLGLDVIAIFHRDHRSVANFEQEINIQLPADIAALLTPS